MISQLDRLVTIKTSLGEDALVIARLHGKEGLSELFSFELELLSEDPQIDFGSIIDNNVTLQLHLTDGGVRFFNGIVASFKQQMFHATNTRLFSYRMTIVPWVWLLSKTIDQRFFQEMTTPDIIEKVFKDHEFSDFQFDLSASYDCHTFCVQYQESDFAFISRLMEQEGIFYYFKHEDGLHTMVLCDNVASLKDCPHQDIAEYHEANSDWFKDDYISAMNWQQEIQSTEHMSTDYNFTMPNADFFAGTVTTSLIGSGNRNYYEYPGVFDTQERGDTLSTIRMEELEVQITKIQGASNCRSFVCGAKFGLVNYFREDRNGVTYLLTSVRHTIEPDGSDHGLTVPLKYTNSFNCIPASVPFRPVRTTPKPRIIGVQTAIVIGPDKEEEINTDEYGRVQVCFHWARKEREDQEISCWIRVGQIAAGPGWGAVFIPRIGHEVLVEFIDGDPDRPIITGQVYHGTNTPPYSLPEEKTKSTIKTSSSTGGDGFNEIRFEDKAEEEELFFHAQRNQTVTVKSNRSETVGNDRSLTVGNDKTETIGQDRILKVGRDEDVTVGLTQKTEVGTDATFNVGGNMKVNAGLNSEYVTGGNMTINAGGNLDLSATNITLTASASLNIICGGTFIKLSSGTLLTNSPGITTIASTTHEIKGAIVKQNC